MTRKFTKYPNNIVASTLSSSSACYIDNYNKWVKPVNVLKNILDMANRALQGSELSVPNIEAIGIADNGQILGFYYLDKTESGNEYSILWQRDGWQLEIYDGLTAEKLHNLADALDRFNDTFAGVRFHEDRPLIDR